MMIIFLSIANKALSLFKQIIGTFIFKTSLQVSKKNVLGEGFQCKGIPFVNFSESALVIIGNSFKINNGERPNSIGRQSKCVFVVKDNAILTIGNNVGISSSTIYSTNKITIGDNVKIGGNVCIYDTDFHSLNFLERRNKQEDVSNTKSKEVIIGNDVFIGAHSTILKGVKIGDNSVIGACSVVTKEVNSSEIWAGNPAKFIRKNILKRNN